MIRIILILLAALTASPAFADTALPYVYGLTVGTSSGAVLATNRARKRVMFINPNVTAKLYVCPAADDRKTGTVNACVVNGAGSIPIYPGAAFLIDGVGGNPLLPSPWNAVADTASSKLTILEWE